MKRDFRETRFPAKFQNRAGGAHHQMYPEPALSAANLPECRPHHCTKGQETEAAHSLNFESERSVERQIDKKEQVEILSMQHEPIVQDLIGN